MAAVYRESGKMIGYILFHEFEEGVYEMGWIYNRSFWRQGYAYASCKAVIDYAFTELNAHKIFAEAIDAVKSAGLMEHEISGIFSKYKAVWDNPDGSVP